MRRVGVIIVVLLANTAAIGGGLRAPSCEALVAFAMGARVDPIEVSFGKSPETMTIDEFDQALDIVSVCLDEVESRPPDVQGLLIRERKRPQFVALTQLTEDLQLYRNQRRERERRAAAASAAR